MQLTIHIEIIQIDLNKSTINPGQLSFDLKIFTFYSMQPILTP